MHGNVRKKKDEVALWEIVTTERKTQPKKRAETYSDRQSRPSARRSEQSRSGQNRNGQNRSRQNRNGQNRSGQSRSIQIIGQDDDGYAMPRRVRQIPAPPPSGSRDRRRSAVYSARAVRRRKAKKRRAYFCRMLASCVVLCCTVLVLMMLGMVYKTVREWKENDNISSVDIPVFREIGKSKIEAPEISTAFLEVNDYSRPGTKLKKIKSIFVHYTANPGTSAVQNRSYFANLAQTKERSASAHYIIGYEGEIVQCIPLDEQAYAVMTRNEDSISIECCYLEKDGKFTQETYDSLVHMLAWLMQEYKLESGDILRHYDCGGKLCPLYYVNNEDAWDKLLADVEAYKGDL